MRKSKATIVMLIIFIIGILTLLYPTISNYYNEKSQSKMIYDYENIINSTNTINFKEVKEQAINYNNQLSKLYEPLLSYDSLNNYQEVLNIDQKGMMGYLTIDKLKVELPIYHGTSNEVLNNGVGHLEGSSFPIGGSSTHSVLSAHRGLPSAKLFSNLDKLAIGDTFKITILDETLVYQVDKISIVKPNEKDNLEIESNKDYVTLLTCTPYGINTHRLLVRGIRINEDTKKLYLVTEGFKINKLIVVPIMTIPIILLLIIFLLIKPIKKSDNSKYDEFLYPNGKKLICGGRKWKK